MKYVISKGGESTEEGWIYKVVSENGDTVEIVDELASGCSLPFETSKKVLVEITEYEYKTAMILNEDNVGFYMDFLKYLVNRGGVPDWVKHDLS